jgi:adenylate kinase
MQQGILLFGCPGSGKGTQGKLLAALPGFHHVATGDLLRALRPESPLYDRTMAYLAKGDLVPDELVMGLLLEHAQTVVRTENDVLVIDGLPRNVRQVELLKNKIAVLRILELYIRDDQLVIDRMCKRALREGRADDATPQVVQHRIEVYRRETAACLEAYPGALLTRIDAHQSVFHVHRDIMGALGDTLNIRFQ